MSSFASYEEISARLRERLPGSTFRANLLFFDTSLAGPIVQCTDDTGKTMIAALCPIEGCLKFTPNTKMPADLAGNLKKHLLNVHQCSLGVMSERAPGDRESLGGAPKPRKPIDIAPTPVESRGVSKRATAKKTTPARKANSTEKSTRSTRSAQKLIKEEPEQNDTVPGDEPAFEVTDAEPITPSTLPISRAVFSFAKITADEACIHFYKAVLEASSEMEKIARLQRFAEVMMSEFLNMTPQMAASRGKELIMLQSTMDEMLEAGELFPMVFDEASYYNGF
jgi:hypothetical protein